MHNTCINAPLICLPLFVFVFFIFYHCMVCPCSKYCFWLPLCDILKLLLNILYSSTCVQNEDYLNLFPVRQLSFSSHDFFSVTMGSRTNVPNPPPSHPDTNPGQRLPEQKAPHHEIMIQSYYIFVYWSSTFCSLLCSFTNCK